MSAFDGGDHTTVWAGTGISRGAWFAFHDGTFQTPQEPVFGLYLLRAAVRGSLLASRAIAAGDVLLPGRFFAASSAMYYTAAFHAFGGFLASRGRVLVSPVHGPPQLYSRPTANGGSMSGTTSLPLPGGPDVLCGILTKSGRWAFERRRRDHASRWREVRQLLNEKGNEIPTYLLRALRYAVMDHQAELSTDDLLEEGPAALANLRHEALYQGFGYDDYAFDNWKEVSGGFLDMRTRALRDLATSLISDALTVVEIALSGCDEGRWDRKHLHASLGLSLLLPAFELDFQVPPLHEEPLLGPRLGRVAAFVFPDIFGEPR